MHREERFHASELYQSMTLPIQETGYIVIHAGPDPEQSPALSGEKLSEQEMKQLRLSAEGIVRETFSGFGTCYRIEQIGFLLMAIGIKDFEASPKGEKAALGAIRRFLEQCVREIWERLQLSVYIAASTIISTQSGLFAVYKEAQTIAVHFSFLDKSMHVLTGYDVQNGLSESALETKKELELLWFNAIANGNYALAGKHAIKILDIRAGAPKTAVTLKQELIARLDYMFYTACDDRKITSEALIYLLSAADNLRGIKNLQSLKAQTEALFSFLINIASEEKPEEALPMAERISSFVNENFSNPQLNATMISEQFGLNSSYLSFMFHKATGVKLLDYIHTVRINHVKHLLRTTRMEITAIAAQLGYISSSAMGRVFSRYVGISPSNYRKSYK